MSVQRRAGRWTVLLLWAVLATDAQVQPKAGENFSCNGRVAGYYADVESGCQLYHLCDSGGRKFTHTCPNTTLFQQRMMICDHWYMVNCSRAESDYSANLLLGQRDQPFLTNRQASQPVSALKSDPRRETSQHSSRQPYINSGKTTTESSKQSDISVKMTVTVRQDQPESSGNDPTGYQQPERPISRYSQDSRGQQSASAGPQITFRYVEAGKFAPLVQSDIGLPRKRPPHQSRSREQKVSLDAALPGQQFSSINGENGNLPTRLASRKNQNTQSQPKRIQLNGYETTDRRVEQSVDTKRVTSNSQVTLENYTRFSKLADLPTINSNGNQHHQSQNTQTEIPNEPKNFTPSPSIQTLPAAYRNNPFFQRYVQTTRSQSPGTTVQSSPQRTSTAKTITTTETTQVAILPHEEQADLNTIIELHILDPRRMFFIPESDSEFSGASNSLDSTVLVELPHGGNHDRTMKFRNILRSPVGRNPSCPQCYPVYLLPGQCEPCVLIR